MTDTLTLLDEIIEAGRRTGQPSIGFFFLSRCVCVRETRAFHLSMSLSLSLSFTSVFTKPFKQKNFYWKKKWLLIFYLEHD